MIGETISHYIIIEKLGEGGMGVVYKALDTTLDRHVAIKFLPPHLSTNEEARKRFIHEAKAASALNQSNIGVIHEIDRTDDGRTFIVMAYYEGETLRERIDKGDIALDEALDITSQIAAGLACAHEKDIVHRDIKPSNILLTRNGEAKIIDFGLAKLRGRTRLTKEGSTVGTAAYMSPEQAKGEEADHRSDIFSLGSILYEMVAGEPPFKGEHEAALLYEIVHELPKPLPTHQENLPESLMSIVERALQKDPAERYQSAVRMLEDLKTTAGISPDERKSRLGSSRKHHSRKTKILTISLFAIITVTIISILFIVRRYVFLSGVDKIPSVAVLYMENLNPDNETDYFVAGITEDIVMELTRIKGLHVLDRGAVEQYRGKPIDAEKAGTELGVEYVLTGSVRMAGDDLLVSGRLISVKDGFLVWGDRYSRTLEDVFEVQADIAGEIARALRVRLSRADEARLLKRPTDNLQAYDFYLRGKQYFDKRGKSENLLAEEMFHRAIALDSLFIDAHVSLAATYAQRRDWGFDRDIKWWNEAVQILENVLELEPDNPDAFNIFGVLYRLRGRYKEAAAWSEKALNISPNDYEFLRTGALIYYFDAQYEKALDCAKRAIPLNPTSPETYRLLGRINRVMGRPEEAERHYRKAVELGPDLAHIRYFLGIFLVARGRFDEARKEYNIAMRIDPDLWYIRWRLGILELLEGNAEEAIEHLEFVRDNGASRPIFYELGCAYEMAGEKEKASDFFMSVIPDIEEELKSSPNYLDGYLDYANILIKLGNTEEGRKVIAHAESVAVRISHEKIPRNRPLFAHAYLSLGDTIRALDYVSQTVNDNLYSPEYIWADPCLESLHHNKEFLNILRRKVGE